MSVTPAMRQYLDAKQQHRDAILFFRMGDFYEMFYEDALVAARALELTLTSRSKDGNGGGIPMCGVPFHAVDTYIARLVKKGYRVAICEQIENPKAAKGVVKRDVVRVVSPGTLTDAAYLDAKEPAFLMAIVATSREYGVALVDLTTGEFDVAEYSGPDGLAALSPRLPSSVRARSSSPPATTPPRRFRRSRGWPGDCPITMPILRSRSRRGRLCSACSSRMSGRRDGRK